MKYSKKLIKIFFSMKYSFYYVLLDFIIVLKV